MRFFFANIDLPTFEYGAHNATGLRRDSTGHYNPLELGVVEDPVCLATNFRFEVLMSKQYHGQFMSTQ